MYAFFEAMDLQWEYIEEDQKDFENWKLLIELGSP
jgi:hypothetical protein